VATQYVAKGKFQKSRSYSIRRNKEARAYLRAYRLPGLTLQWTPIRGVSAFLRSISNQIPYVNQFTLDAYELVYNDWVFGSFKMTDAGSRSRRTL
jgi:hypothetical protein